MKTTGRRPRWVPRFRSRQAITSTSDMEVENVESGLLVEGNDRMSFQRKLKTMTKYLERAALIADIMDTLAKITDFI
jgi:hypothetical protein